MNKLEIIESAAAARRAEQRLLVVSVANAYAWCRNLPAICATNPDPNTSRRSSRWTPDTAGFVIDTERAIAKVIGDQHDRDVLFAAWKQLQEDDAVIGVDGARLIRLAAPIFAKHGLRPAEYFRPGKAVHR